MTREDPLYEAVSAGQRFPGLEHWLPLFHDSLDTLLDYLPGASLVLDAAPTPVAFSLDVPELTWVFGTAALLTLAGMADSWPQPD